MKLKVNYKCFILTCIFMLIISANNVALCKNKYYCVDIATDQWINDGKLSAEPFYGGNLSLKEMTEQITTSSIAVTWEFLRDGVNLDVINEYGLQEDYKNAVKKALITLETFSGAGTNGGEVVPVSKILGEDENGDP